MAYCTKFGFRYPTEAEWEYACRAGTEEFNTKDLKDYAWFYRNSKGVSHPVGLKKANAWGLHDMLGNVEEWCSDWFEVYSKKAVIDPTGPETGAPDWLHVARSDNAKSPDWCTRPAMRNPHCKGHTPYRAGFRVVMDLPVE